MIKSIKFASIPVTDQDRALAFYTEKLGFTVFTDKPLAGNQLAVFTETAGLTAAEMQAMTRETKFSECTFVQPAEAAGTDLSAEARSAKAGRR